jgi:hypothetical protein
MSNFDLSIKKLRKTCQNFKILGWISKGSLTESGSGSKSGSIMTRLVSGFKFLFYFISSGMLQIETTVSPAEKKGRPAMLG